MRLIQRINKRALEQLSKQRPGAKEMNLQEQSAKFLFSNNAWNVRVDVQHKRSNSDAQKIEAVQIPITGKDHLYLFQARLISAFVEPSTADLVTPWILFIAAISGPIWGPGLR